MIAFCVDWKCWLARPLSGSIQYQSVADPMPAQRYNANVFAYRRTDHSARLVVFGWKCSRCTGHHVSLPWPLSSEVDFQWESENFYRRALNDCFYLFIVFVYVTDGRTAARTKYNQMCHSKCGPRCVHESLQWTGYTEMDSIQNSEFIIAGWTGNNMNYYLFRRNRVVEIHT